MRCKKKYLQNALKEEENKLNEFNAIGRDTALLHFYFKEDPDSWSDEKFAKMQVRLNYVLTTLAEKRLL